MKNLNVLIYLNINLRQHKNKLQEKKIQIS